MVANKLGLLPSKCWRWILATVKSLDGYAVRRSIAPMLFAGYHRTWRARMRLPRVLRTTCGKATQWLGRRCFGLGTLSSQAQHRGGYLYWRQTITCSV